MSSTSYAVADRRRLLPDDATVATQAPSLELIPALVKAVEHAVSSSAAVSLAVSLCTLTPAMAASARSLAFFFNLASLMSPRIASRVFSAAAFLSWAEGAADGDDEGDDDTAEHVVASPPGTAVTGGSGPASALRRLHLARAGAR